MTPRQREAVAIYQGGRVAPCEVADALCISRQAANQLLRRADALKPGAAYSISPRLSHIYRQAGRVGGLTTAINRTDEERSEAARHAARARWARDQSCSCTFGPNGERWSVCSLCGRE